MSDRAGDQLLLDLLEIARARGWQIRTVNGATASKPVSKYQVYAPENLGTSRPMRAQMLLLQGLLNIDPSECDFLSHEVRVNGEWVLDAIWVPSQWHYADGSRPETDDFEKDGGPNDGKERLAFEPVKGTWEKQRGAYIVTFTPDGSRCSCAYAQSHEDPETGSTLPCSHQQLAAWVRLRWYDTHDPSSPYPLDGEERVRKEIQRADQETLGPDRPG